MSTPSDPSSPQDPVTGGAPPVSDNGKLLAIACHASPFIGFPVWIVPLILRDDPFALYHAKQAGVVGIGFLATFAIVFFFAFATCGMGAFLVPIVFVWWAPAVHGIVIALNGKCEPVFGVGPFADKVFGGIQLKGPSEKS